MTLRINSSSHMFYMNSFRWFTFKKKINGFVLVYIGSKAGKTGLSRLDPAQNCHGGPGIDVLQSSTNPYIGLSPHHLEHPIASQIGVLVANLFFFCLVGFLFVV